MEQDEGAARLSDIAARARQQTAPQFRAVRGPAGIIPVKLEPFWWKQLEDLAWTHGVSLGALLATLLEALPPHENRTAFLRRCAAVSLQPAKGRENVTPSEPLRTIVAAATRPAMIIARRAGPEFLNAAMIESLSRRRLTSYEPFAPGELILRTPVPDLIKRVKAAAPGSGSGSGSGSGPADAHIEFEFDGRTIGITARITHFLVAVNSNAPQERPVFDDWLICFAR